MQFHDPKIYTAYALVAARATTLMKERTRMVQFLRALIRAERYVQENQQDSIALLAKELGMDSALLKAIWSEYELNVALDPKLQSVFEDAGKWAKRAQPTLASAPTPSYAGVIDSSVLESARSAGSAAAK